ncbi:MAG: hypothetical protein QOJ52_4322 [Acidimicrobiaceae bacterium]|nr:hypothetical protein [Acidimicrobiaceae bacterium]
MHSAPCSTATERPLVRSTIECRGVVKRQPLTELSLPLAIKPHLRTFCSLAYRHFAIVAMFVNARDHRERL